eukprot:TRINITY_DN4147_c0_g1_i2.p1 TRINITY_DN4147_c0_g1~~TRINITY_DN4147_c0_g1_i2.p1  ORF type:complete len:471 (-),score=51.59 TRINITY_DN4147_c0_g1_i2:63-1475(-)
MKTTWIIVWVLSNIGVCFGLKETVVKNVKSGSLVDIESFGFTAGGTANIQFDEFTYGNMRSDVPTNSTFFFYSCTATGYRTLLSRQYRDGDSICEEPSKFLDCWITNGDGEKTIKFDSKDNYYFAALNCAQRDLRVQISFEFLNPNGQQLSFGDIPLPKVYLTFALLWAIGLAGWAYFCRRYARNCIPLHKLLLIIVALKFLVVAAAFSYWQIYETTGESFAAIRYTQSFLFAGAETGFFCALLILAKGWRIIHSTIPTTEIRTIVVALVLLLATLLFFTFYNDGYYFLSLMIMYFFMLPKIFTSITRNTRALEGQLFLLSHANGANRHNDEQAIREKIKLFKYLRSSVIIYLACILLVNSMRIVLIWYLEWLNYFLNELVSLIMTLLICFILLPRNAPLFARVTLLDTSVLPFMGIQDIRFDEQQNGLRSEEVGASDMSDIVVMEYPHRKKHSSSLAIGLLDQRVPHSE